MARWILFLLTLVSVLVAAQTPPPPPPANAEAPAFSQAELDQMLAPIALYPDELLSQILMAATYPLEVVQAARWSRAHPSLRGEDAVSAAASEPWEPSVKSLLAFPQILSMMDEKLDWTQRLGNAFLAQEQQVMDTVQELRRRAYAAGNLRSNEYVRVEEQASTLVVVPAYPSVVYVPYYSPFVVYGSWWWPAYPPVYWPPWPGYVVVPGVSVVYTSSVGVAISVGFFFGAFDWPHRHVVIVRPPPPFFHPPGHRPAPAVSPRAPAVSPRAPVVWRHDPVHRRGVPYRTEPVRREFGQPPRPAAAAPRLEYRGRESPTPQAPFARQAPAAPRAQPSAPFRAPPPAPVPRAQPPAPVRAQPSAPVRVQPPAPVRAQPSAPVRAQPSAPPPHAFEGIGAGAARTREFSARGQASLSHGPAPGAAPRTGSAPKAGGAPRGRQ